MKYSGQFSESMKGNQSIGLKKRSLYAQHICLICTHLMSDDSVNFYALVYIPKTHVRIFEI